MWRDEDGSLMADWYCAVQRSGGGGADQVRSHADSVSRPNLRASKRKATLEDAPWGHCKPGANPGSPPWGVLLMRNPWIPLGDPQRGPGWGISKVP